VTLYALQVGQLDAGDGRKREKRGGDGERVDGIDKIQNWQSKLTQ
jgi:hypothetical protein